jgi:hypothetical protein
VTSLNGATSALLSESVVVTSNTLNNPRTLQSIITSGTETLPGLTQHTVGTSKTVKQLGLAKK